VAVTRDIARERGEPIETMALQAPIYPLLEPGDLQGGCQAFLETQANFLVATYPTDPHDFHWALVDDGEFSRMYFGDRYLMDRALLPRLRSPSGAIKLARVEALEQVVAFFGDRLVPYDLPRERSVSIGEEFDLVIADQLAHERAREV
jgi:CMP-N-acetylneuraminic acid synthetase